MFRRRSAPLPPRGVRRDSASSRREDRIPSLAHVSFTVSPRPEGPNASRADVWELHPAAYRKNGAPICAPHVTWLRTTACNAGLRLARRKAKAIGFAGRPETARRLQVQRDANSLPNPQAQWLVDLPIPHCRFRTASQCCHFWGAL